MRRVHGQFSRIASGRWPGAVVRTEGGDEWVLDRPGEEPVGLGDREHDALLALRALLARARKEEDARS